MAVHGDARGASCEVPHRAERAEAAGEVRVGRERREQGVVLSPGQGGVRVGSQGRGLEVDHDGVPDAALAREVRERDADVGWQLAPTPPIADGPAAALAGATAMLDLSDGLALDASRLARASGVVLDLESTALGVDPHAALAGGEDHSLLATFPADADLPGGFRRLGTVRDVEGGAPRVAVDGHDLGEPGGWDPYRLWTGQQG